MGVGSGFGSAAPGRYEGGVSDADHTLLPRKLPLRKPLGRRSIRREDREGAYSTSQSRIVGLFGPLFGATGLPSGPIPDACLGSAAGPGSETAAAGGRSSPLLRPQPARPSAAMSALIAAILARARLDD